MKKLVVLLTLVAAASAFSQGQVNFQNRLTTFGVDAPISYPDGGPALAGRINGTVTAEPFSGWNARAALYGAAAGTAEDALSIITPAVPFRTTAATAGYIDPNADGGNSTRTVPGVDIGQAGVFQVRAWDTGDACASFEDAMARLGQQEFYAGKSVLVNITSLGGGSVAPSPLTGLEAFTLTYFPVPEPSIIGLGLLGAVAGMVVFRRRR